MMGMCLYDGESERLTVQMTAMLYDRRGLKYRKYSLPSSDETSREGEANVYAINIGFL